MLFIHAIPAFDDNYIWLLRHPDRASAVVVDPGDEGPVLEYLRQERVALEAILITHKHADHTGGVRELCAAYPNIPVFGPAHERIPTITHPVTEGDRVELPGIGVLFEVMEVPGHTEGHLAYYGDGTLFCGDTLFSGGCGRVFSGTHEQLHKSLQRIALLPLETLVYCAHEYTQANLGFAEWVEPESTTLQQRVVETGLQRGRGEPTVPSSLQEERDTNPFLRTGEPVVIQAAERYAGRTLNSGAEVFRTIRTWKDQEYD